MDVVHVQLFNRRKTRVLTTVDAFTRLASTIKARFNWRGATVVDVLERVCLDTGYPRKGRVDWGPECVTNKS
jgi:putative transposase